MQRFTQTSFHPDVEMIKKKKTLKEHERTKLQL